MREGQGLGPLLVCLLHSWWRYRGASLERNSAPLGPYSRTMHRSPWWSQGGGLFLMSEALLYATPESSGVEGKALGFDKELVGISGLWFGSWDLSFWCSGVRV